MHLFLSIFISILSFSKPNERNISIRSQMTINQRTLFVKSIVLVKRVLRSQWIKTATTILVSTKKTAHVWYHFHAIYLELSTKNEKISISPFLLSGENSGLHGESRSAFFGI